MNLNFDFNGKTTLAKWWLIVKENFQKIATAFNAEVQARKDAVSAEASARQTADSDLASRLSNVEKISGGTGGGNSLNNYEYDYDSEDDTVINIYTVTALPSGIYTFIPEKEVTALYTVIADGTAPWYSLNNIFTPGNQYILQAGDSDNMDVIGVIPLEPDSGDFVDVKLSEIVTAEYTNGVYRFDVSIFAEQNKTLVIFNDLDNDVPDLPVNDMYGYTITQALEAGKLYVTVTTKLHEDNGIDGQYSGAIDVYAWNGPESSGGSSITVDSELSDASENPLQNKAIKAELDKKYEASEDATYFLNQLAKTGVNDVDFNGAFAVKQLWVVDDEGNYEQVTNKKTATIVIGTSVSNHAAVNVDYLCDGTADQEEINNAISALPESGGKIVLLDGTYNISGTINVNKDNVTIAGMGKGTVLKRMFNDASYANNGLIKITVNHCKVSDLCINGNKTTYSRDANAGITVFSSFDNVISRIYIYDEYRGVYFAGSATHNFVHQIYTENVYYGVMLYYSTLNTVSDCVFENNTYGVFTEYYAHQNIISLNKIISPAVAGIHISGDSKNEIVNSNVVVKGTDTQYSIYVAGTYNIVVDNQLPSMPHTDASGGSTNTFENNL